MMEAPVASAHTAPPARKGKGEGKRCQELRQAKRPERLAWAYRRLAAAVRFLSQVQIIDFNESAIRRYEQLRKSKVKVRKMDLRIAATALERGAILVKRNVRDFRQAPGLHVEDWSA